MSSAILQPGRNVWRIARARRAAVLVDGAAFFGAVRRAFLNARRSIFIVGWDVDSRTRLVGDHDPDDGYSPLLSEFLSQVVEARPDLRVYILLWDFSIVYTAERELFPRVSLQWQTPDRVTLCMDDAVPFGSSQHQKLIVVDDALAFSGGLDLTQRRWDTQDHQPANASRVDSSQHPYDPFHDIQMMVDGDAAKALAVLARRRWCNAYGTEPPIEPVGDPWPDHVRPDFENVEIGIARTQPAFGQQEEVREVEALFMDSIEHAERSIYIENQFLTSMPVAEKIAEQMRRQPALEVVAIAPRSYEASIVINTLGQERARFSQILNECDPNRVRLVYPSVRKGSDHADTMVHSKVMIVDDRFLRVGSANLNNRSMGADTECDLAIEARNENERTNILRLRNALLAHHCGASADAITAEIERGGSLLSVVDRLSSNGHCLRPIRDEAPTGNPVHEVAKEIVDPKEPLRLARFAQRLENVLPGRAVLFGAIAIAVVVLGLTAIWHITPIGDLVTRERVQLLLSSVSQSQWAPFLVVSAYLMAGLVAFPVVILIVATAVTFGPIYGFLYALVGVLASAIVLYFIGATLGRDLVRSLLGARGEKVKHAIEARGMLAVAAIRLVPVAPFTVVNLAAGACSVRLSDYVLGTVIGMLPGLIAISISGHQLTALITDFSAVNLAWLVAFIAGWGVLAWGAQTLVLRLRRRAS